MSTRLAIITTHPIQYNAPLFQLLAQQKGICLKVFYTWCQSKAKVYDPGFGQAVSWDIPLLDGYDYEFIENIASKPGSNHFWGIQTPRLIHEIETFQADVLLVFGWSFYSHLQVLRHFKGKIPIWFRGDSHLLDEPPGWSVKKVLRRVLLRWVYTHINKALYVGSANRNYYETHGLSQSRLLFGPHAIDNDRFQENSVEEENQALLWRNNLRIPAQAIVFLFVGKLLEPKKNPTALLRAFMAMKHPDAYLFFVGEGPESSILKNMAAGNDKVVFLGFQNQKQMPIVYRLGDVLVLPSQGPGETWGLAVNEAFACARPAIVSNKVGCGQDLISPNQTGWVFNASDEQTLLKSMQEALQLGKNGLSQMGLEAAQKIKSWSYSQVVEKIMQEISRLNQ